MTQLRLHARAPASRANGPGLRAVLWTQGCRLACPGCFNPAAQDPRGGRLVPVAELAGWLAQRAPGLEGLTVSGGEPFDQLPALAALLGEVRRRTPLSVALFTGWTWAELRSSPRANEVLDHVDLLVAGRFDAAAGPPRGLLGSPNQTAHFLTGRYGPADIAQSPAGEVIVHPDGRVVLTGIDGLRELEGFEPG